MRRVLPALAAILLGALASEGFMRAILEPDALFEFSFSPGAQSPHPKYGFVFTPSWSGYMRHPDRVWCVPLAFEQHGYRLPAPARGGEQPLRAVLLGGRSTAMCYGLRDHETIHHRMAERSPRPLEVWDTGWAGFDVYRSWKYFEEGLGAELDFDVVLLCINPQRTDLFLKSIPEDLGEVRPHPVQDVMFDLTDGIVRVPSDAVERWMGRNYFRSYVVYGFLRYRKDLRRGWSDALQRLGVREPAARPTLPPEQQAELERQGQERLTRFLELLDEHFRARGARLAVVLLPSMAGARDAYAPIVAAIPPAIPHADLHDALWGQLRPQDYIGLGHYGEQQALLIADGMLRLVERLVGEED